MDDKNFIWNLLKNDIEMAVDEGYKLGYNNEVNSREGGQFQAYQYVLDKMKELEGGYINE